MQITIKTDFADIQRRLNTLSLDLQNKIVPAALNKTIAKAKTTMGREITRAYQISSAEVSANLKITRAKRTVGNWSAILDPYLRNKRGRGFNVIRFVERKVTIAERKRRRNAGNQQIGFQIKRGAGTKFIKGAFIGNQGRTVFMRTTDKRLPIKAVTTIDVAQMFNTKRINRAVMQRIQQELPVEFERAINAAVKGVF